MLRQFSIRLRIIALIILFTVSSAVLLAVIVATGNMLKNQGIADSVAMMLEGEKEKLMVGTHTVARILGKKLEGVGDPRQQAEAIAAYINDIRFEEDESGYYYVYRGTTVFVHPVQPQLAGKDLNDTKDVNGVYFVRELNNEARKGGGFVSYIFGKPLPGGTMKNAPKLAYVEMIPGTDLWVSAGVYIDNLDKHKAQVEETMSASLYRIMYIVLGGAAAGGLLLVLPLCVLIVKSLTGPLRETTLAAERVAAGDFSVALSISGKDEISALQKSLRLMVRQLMSMIAATEEKSKEAERQAAAALQAQQEAMEAKAAAEKAKKDGMHQAAGQLDEIVTHTRQTEERLLALIQASSDGVKVQQKHSQETAMGMEQMSAAVHDVARNTASASKTAEETKENAQGGARIVTDTIAAIHEASGKADLIAKSMAALDEQAKNIGQVMNVISDIADQTNLLALNAAIEAARAGDAGRGFAVVADEVRKLAEKTMNATHEVAAATKAIQDSASANLRAVGEVVGATAKSTQLAQSAGDSLNSIVALADANAAQAQVIASASEEQSASADLIRQRTAEVSRVATDNAALMVEADSAVTELAKSINRIVAVMDSLSKA
ncbi:MAG: methyl-accepting chemotaxis protein [Deltaproteobacteria bacterium]|jgi:methyl-accepting chemotaxis protein|nr:methyl-accepting chemotaxis protein [Deltaproteobacteria bacterium]